MSTRKEGCALPQMRKVLCLELQTCQPRDPYKSIFGMGVGGSVVKGAPCGSARHGAERSRALTGCRAAAGQGR
jgi:hypothetical protein